MFQYMNTKEYEIVDLSVAFQMGMPKYNAKWFPEFNYKEIAPADLVNNDWKRKFTVVSMFAHNGTHVETSEHVFRDGNTLGKFGLESYIGYPVIINLDTISDGVGITGEDILSRIQNRKIEENSIIILRTGYDDREWGKEGFWDRSPWLEQQAAEIIANLKPKMVGLDFQTERPNEKNFIIHKTLASQKCIICEYLFNLNKIDENCLFMAIPIHMPEMEAAPVRAVAIKNKEKREGEI